eukprot:TRINITY_DN7553_c0_g1_i1.p1 TRINITY_DN7553_c0_g1~~TRINITY_DN7553_c0_g1_i1.p1  ORF type:complete len:246 (+),score=30.10 TRINITY_DN7553_c0_g1_i1:136-873(+)
MLPIHMESERPSFAASPSFSEYMRRMIQYAQMDIDYTFAQMIYLCLAPRKVYQLTSYRKQTKNQWARDDPAFIVVLIFFLAISAIAYGLALQIRGTGFLRILSLFICCHFALSGAAIATLSWFISNKYLRVKSFHGVEQRMEWMYAFDIHCNAFFPLFLVLYVIHYFLLPFLVQPTTAAMLVSNALYAVALCYYLYITSLGYSALPFLERTEVFLHPTALVVFATVVLCLLKINLTRLSVLALGA